MYISYLWLCDRLSDRFRAVELYSLPERPRLEPVAISEVNLEMPSCNLVDNLVIMVPSIPQDQQLYTCLKLTEPCRNELFELYIIKIW